MFKKKTYCLCLKPIFKISSFSLSIAFKKKKKIATVILMEPPF